METLQFAVYAGGDWVCVDDCWRYVGNVHSKHMIMKKGSTMDDLRRLIGSRFNLCLDKHDITLTYGNTINPSLHPFDIESWEDFEMFVDTNNLGNISWSIPMCVTTREKRPIEETMITTNGMDNSSIILYDEQAAMSRLIEGAERGSIILNPGYGAIGYPNEEDPEQSARIDFVESLQQRWELKIGHTYKSKKELKVALALNAIYNCSQYKIEKSKKAAVLARCEDKECKWRARFSMLGKSRDFTMTKYINIHTCSFETRRCNRRKASVTVIAHLLGDMYANVNRLPEPLAVQGVLKNQHQIEASYWVCWKAIETVKEMMRGSFEENYKGVPAYMQKLRDANVGSVVALDIDQDSKFRFVFFAFGQSIRGYEALRKVISVDGTFLKGKYGGVLLVATGQDANQQIYPLAYAIVDGENDDAWDFFFRNLRRCVADRTDQLFVSDRHRSIKKAIAMNFPNSHHGVCMYHLKQNIKKRSTDKRIQQMFEDAARCYKKDKCLELFGIIDGEKPKVGHLLTDVGFETWSRAYSPVKRYNILTSNNAETINRVMLDAREYPVLALVDEIRKVMSRWFAQRREKAQLCKDLATPKVEGIIQKKYIDATRYACYILDSERMLYQVKWGVEDELVSVVDRTCTCKEFEMEEIPCVHAIAVTKTLEINPATLVSEYYNVDAWRRAYEEIIYPVLGSIDYDIPSCIEDIQCNPPSKKKRCGRLPKARIRGSGEGKKTKCACCGMLGHNKKTCRNQPIVSKG